MVSRSREGRRRSNRTPGIWRGPLSPTRQTTRPPVQHGARGRDFFGWRIISGLLVIGLGAVLFLFFSTNVFYIHSIAVGGLQYLTREEVFTLSGIANVHVFWVDPVKVRQNILRSPSVAEAQVQVGWPPTMVQVVIEERQPALIWAQAGVTTWIDLQGRVMLLRADQPGLIQIVADSTFGDPPGPNVQLEAGIVSGALQLQSLFPNLSRLRYHPEKGLGYNDERGWEVWFGIGTNMPDKIRVYDAIVENLLGRGRQPTQVNVANPHAPYYSVRGG